MRVPRDIVELIRSRARPGGGVEHVSVHPRPALGVVVGVYVLADCLEDAEETAAELCRRAVHEIGLLQGWRVGRSEVPLLAPYVFDDPMD